MRNLQRALSFQIFLFILFVSGTLAGLLTLLAHIWPGLPIPHDLVVTVQGALALILGGILMVAIMLSYRRLQLVTGAILVLMAGSQVIHNFWAGNTAPGFVLGVEIEKLGNIPAMGIIILGMMGIFGVQKPLGQAYARLVGLIGLVCGIAILVVYAFQPPEDSGQLVFGVTRVVCWFAIGYGLLLMWLPKMLKVPLYLGRVEMIAGFVSLMGTFFLLIVASWGIQDQRQQAARLFLQTLEVVLESEFQETQELIERFADRWSALGFDVPEELQQTELRRYLNDLQALQALVVFNGSGDMIVAKGKSQFSTDWLVRQLSRPRFVEWIDSVIGSNQKYGWIFPNDKSFPTIVLLVTPENPVGGKVFASFDLSTLLNPMFSLVPNEFRIHLEMAPTGDTAHVRGDIFRERIDIRLRNGPTLSLVAVAEPVSFWSWQGILIPGILGFGIIVSMLIMLACGFAVNQRKKSRELSVEEQRFRSLFYQSPEPVFEFDREGRCVSVNEAASSLIGLNGEDPRQQTYQSMILPSQMSREDFQIFETAFKGAVQGKPQAISVKYVTIDGNKQDFECSFSPIVVDGEVIGVYVVGNNVTERHIAQENQRLLTRCLETSDNGVLLVDLRGPAQMITFVNSAFTDITGYPRDSVLNTPFQSLVGNLFEADDLKRIDEVIRDLRTCTLVFKTKKQDGQMTWNQLSLAPVSSDSGVVSHYTIIMKDVSQQLEQARKLEYQARYDVLTGLPNRAYFEERLVEEISQSKIKGTRLALLFIDLDEFKPINDALGHRVGDQVLVSIVQAMQKLLRPGDFLARFGGDEFVLFLPDLHSEEDAIQMAEMLIASFGQLHRIGHNELYVTASIGISISQPDSTPDKLLQEADIAMYKAKQQGRDTYVVFADDLDEKAAIRVHLRNELQDAMNGNQLFLNFQPQVDRQGKVCGVEALVRWRHPTKGLIPPISFIRVAEETGQIIRLGRWVMTQACKDARRLLDLGLLANARMSVNLSPLQFHRRGFVDRLKDILSQTHLPAECLDLELTEGILMRNTETAIQLIGKLQDLGVSTSIDDFGMGFSSLSYLKNLPVHNIKIDRSFVENVTTSSKDAAICQGIITMAGQMGMRVVAEGVETWEQFSVLQRFGCDAFQGYYFSRPLDFDDLVTWLSKEKK